MKTALIAGITGQDGSYLAEHLLQYLDDWNPDSLKGALSKAENIKIDVEKTIEKLRPLSWEPRFNKAIDIIFDEFQSNGDQIEWI